MNACDPYSGPTDPNIHDVDGPTMPSLSPGDEAET